MFDCTTLPDPWLCAAAIADILWVRSLTNPVRPSILGFLHAARFEIYDTTQGLARDPRPGFQRGRAVATGTIAQHAYHCTPIDTTSPPSAAATVTVYSKAKTLEQRHGITQGSLPSRVVLVSHAGCTLAGMRALVKEAGARIEAKVKVAREGPTVCSHTHKRGMEQAEGSKAAIQGTEFQNYKRSKTHMGTNVGQDSCSTGNNNNNNTGALFLSGQYVRTGRCFIQGLRDAAADLPSLSRLSAELKLKMSAVSAGMERAQLITGPTELVEIASQFVAAGLIQLSTLQEKSASTQLSIRNAHIARDILQGLDMSRHAGSGLQFGEGQGRGGGRRLGPDPPHGLGLLGQGSPATSQTDGSTGSGYSRGLGHGLGVGLSIGLGLCHGLPVPPTGLQQETQIPVWIGQVQHGDGAPHAL